MLDMLHETAHIPNVHMVFIILCTMGLTFLGAFNFVRCLGFKKKYVSIAVSPLSWYFSGTTLNSCVKKMDTLHLTPTA